MSRPTAALLALCAVALTTVGCASRDLAPAAPDAGATISDGGPVDAGSPLDGGPAGDGGPIRDGGATPDGGLDADGGAPDDGGALTDGGALDDGGTAEDGGALADGGSMVDGGSDGGSPDGGAIPDAGTALPCQTGGASGESEPNNAPAQAVRIATAQTVQGHIAPEQDVDWYLLDVCAESLLSISMSLEGDAEPPPDGGAPGGTTVDLRVELLGADGTTLLNWQQDRTGEDGPTSLELVAYVERPGPVYLRVTDIGDTEEDRQHPYQLTVDTSPVPDADSEPDGNQGPVASSALAHPLAEGAVASAFLASARDEDWYRISTPGPRIARVTLTDAPELGTPLGYRIRLLGPDGLTELGRTEGRPPGNLQSASVEISAQLPAAGDYFVVVSDRADAWDITRPYKVSFTLSDIPDAPLEPNDGPADAHPLTAGVEIQGFISAPSDQDWFAITSGEPRILSARLLVPNGLRTVVDYVVTVLAPDGSTALAEVTDFDGQFGDIDLTALAYAPTSAQPYYVAVSDWRSDDADIALPYRLVVEFLSVPDASIEPNETAGAATELSPGQPTTAYIANQRDRDYFVFDVLAGQTITAALTASNTPIRYQVSIFDQTGSTVLTSDFDVDGQVLPNDLNVTTVASRDARYFVAVQDVGGDDADLSTPYTLTVTLTGP